MEDQLEALLRTAGAAVLLGRAGIGQSGDRFLIDLRVAQVVLQAVRADVVVVGDRRGADGARETEAWMSCGRRWLLT